MPLLSRPLTELKARYTVVVIGSGYGGGIAASRLSRAGQSVCVLERGREWQAGDFPKTPQDALLEMQVETEIGREGKATGLFDFHFGEDINVLRGCGLGGTSLINANVALKADPRVFDDERWPRALRQDIGGLLADGYARAVEMLRPAPYPEGKPGYPLLAKYAALKKGGAEIGQQTYYPPINVNWTVNGPNHVGVEQQPCNLCGDCVSGCNNKAKNTTAMNYLPDAYNHGAEIFCEIRVDSIEARDGGYVVHYSPVDAGRERFGGAPDLFVKADVVVLAAGSLGSTEILLRSKAKGLTTSGLVGDHFTGNGDALGFAYNATDVVNGIGAGVRDPKTMEPSGPGPCIVGVIDARPAPVPLENGFVIEDGSPPGALGAALNLALLVASKENGKPTTSGLAKHVAQLERVAVGQIRGPYHGALHHTQSFLSMSNDDGLGRIRLQGEGLGHLNIDWPGVGKQPIFQTVADGMLKATEAIAGTFVPNPEWVDLQTHPLITVHPLGGCVMGEDPEHGVVNDRGQVYTGMGTEVYKGLYVSDGAVVPRPVGVNPLFTISAVAERAMFLLAKDRGWNIDYTLPSAPPAAPAPAKAAIGVRFTEKMQGFFSTHQKDNYEAGYTQGQQEDSNLAFVLTIACDDVNAMLNDPLHRMEIEGTVVARALGNQPLTVADGSFQLFSPDLTQVGTTNMWYRMKLTGEDGQHYWFEGFKVVHDHGGGLLDGWPDTTTLYTTVWKGPDNTGEMVGKGILRIAPADFARQLTTMEAVGGGTRLERLDALGRFGKFFVGTLWDTYGGVAAPQSYFNPDSPPRTKRPLRAPAPATYPLPTDDGKTLRLTRYQGGDKGPLLVIHGLGVSSLVNTIDTIDTTLVEFFCAHGYDVWLLDWRASIALPYAAQRWNGDQVAQYDHPAAVKKVLELTGARSVQVLPHCVGSLTFFMSMLSGLQGVRSIGVSQVSCHPIGGALVRLKSDLHLPSVMDRLGVTSMSAYTDAHADWANRLFDEYLRLYPVPFGQVCTSTVCHRISFLYNLLYEHAQLNDATHDAMHEMFGVGNVDIFEHLSVMNRAEQLLGADGADRYLPNYAMLKLPIRFLTGAQNITFTPAANRRTFDWLCSKNGAALYDYVEVPGYGHIDCLFGKNAVADVFPYWLEHFEKTATDR